MTAPDRGPRHRPGSSGTNLGDRYVVEGTRGRYLLTDLSTGATVGPLYLHHADAALAADKRNHPAGTKPATRQGDLFDTQEA